MKRILSKISLLSAVLLLLLAAPMTALADGGGDGTLTQTADGYQVTLVFEEPVASGENKMHVQVADAHGQPVSNALIEVAVIAAQDEHSEVEEEADHVEAQDTAPEVDQLLQFALIGLGFAGSLLFVVYRIARENYAKEKVRVMFAPHAALMVILGVMNIWLLILPMAMRM